MKLKLWLVKIAVSLLVALVAPIIIAAAISLIPELKLLTIAELVSTSMSGAKWAAYISVVIAAFILVLLAQVIAGPFEEGAVKWFNVSKGFGFVTRENGEDVFVHFRSIRGRGHRSLQEGQRVRFGVVESSKGLQAEDVTILRQK